MSTVVSDPALQERCIETIRFLAVDGVQKANSGHPGMPMGAAAVAYTLFTRHLRYDPADPAWPNRDRFVLSAGHAQHAALLPAAPDRLRPDAWTTSRRSASGAAARPGHPEYGHTAGVETTTGPLGQGVANAVGMAVAERFLAATVRRRRRRPLHLRARRRRRHDGGHQQRGRLATPATSSSASSILLYDDNHITIDGSTDLAFTEDVGKRFEAYGWHVQRVADGDDVDAIDAAITAAKAETHKPSFIAVRTHIGCGSPNKQDRAAAHGAPLGADEVKLTKEACEWPLDPEFFVPEDVLAAFRAAGKQAAAAHAEWTQKYEAWRAADGARAKSWDDAWSRTLPEGWDADLPVFTTEDKIATRAASGKVINAVAPHLPTFMGGSADLAPSNNTLIKDAPDQQAATPGGRNVRWGVRELGMAAMGNGLSVHGGIRAVRGHLLRVRRLHAPGDASLRAHEAAGDRTCSRTTVSASARTARPISPSSTSPCCVRRRGSSTCVRPTPTRRSKPGRSPSRPTTRPSASC